MLGFSLYLIHMYRLGFMPYQQSGETTYSSLLGPHCHCYLHYPPSGVQTALWCGHHSPRLKCLALGKLECVDSRPLLSYLCVPAGTRSFLTAFSFVRNAVSPPRRQTHVKHEANANQLLCYKLVHSYSFKTVLTPYSMFLPWISFKSIKGCLC